MTETISHHHALIYTMVTISAADRTMTDSELLTIGDLVQTLPVFRDFESEALVETAENCGDMLQGDDGLDAVLDLIANSLPRKLYDTAYALAVEVAAADLHVEQEELRFLQLLRDKLDLDKLTVAAIEHSARVRHRVA
ncbi:tellurite resistance TerB family protein [Breoghania sp. L-A4]|uniref:tellurite resistance TerB family protein n=1 Tax=Breoghania sp. L-A4 TaxID=2304600 RepID=UPI000E3597FE|nr:tellurite resistance TerB family protein [Breoghania sp. L-A4]AXS39634.1 Tellurite resistance protein TerB [Breoghania sp. L-A4]